MIWRGNLTLIGAIRLSGRVQQSMQFATANGERCLTRVARRLLPKLTHGDVIVLDNIKAHHHRRIAAERARRGVWILYLPPCSPDLNPYPMHRTRLVKSSVRSDKFCAVLPEDRNHPRGRAAEDVMSKVTDSGARTTWARLIEELASSGERPKKFAARRGVNVQTLYWWRSKLRREAAVANTHSSRTKVASAESRTTSRPSRPVSPREFPLARVVRGEIVRQPEIRSPVRVMVGSVRISIDTGFDREVLSTLLSVLGVEVRR